MSNLAELKDILGVTMKSVERIADEEIVFTTVAGDIFKLLHEQDCCEFVTIEDIVGDLEDLVGEPILLAEEVSNSDNPNSDNPNSDNPKSEWTDSCTWTFYKFATRKGYVDIRWYGESNGYYSESVEFD